MRQHLAGMCSRGWMTRYAGFLATRKPFTEVYLARHEVVADALEGPYRFTVEALWDN